jgi:multiple sugar transport system substrate-binding protein
VSYTRRDVLRMAGAGGAAVWLGGCGSSNTATPVPGDPWKQYAGTTLNFISENTAPTSAIAANLEPFKQLTGIDIKITQLELAAMVQRVALDFASGEGAYQIVYADPYQVMAPYHEALADLTAFQKDPDLPHAESFDDFVGFQLDASGRFGDRDKLYALPYDAPTMIWMYRKDLFEKHGEQMKQDLGFDPNPREDSTWDDFHKTSKWFKDNADKTGVPYGHGHMAKQHDSLMNDFSNLLWAYGGTYFEDDEKVGSLGSADPGEPQLTKPEALEAADVYRRLVAIAHPSSLGWDWTGLAEGFMAGSMAMAPLWHEFASGIETSDIKGKVGYARLPRGPKRSANMFGGTGIGVNGVSPEKEQRAAWLFVVWSTQKATQLANLKSKVGGGTPTRDSVYKLPEVEKARKPPSKLPNMLSMDAVFEAWKPENVGLRPKIAAWNECDTTIFTQLSKMLAGQQGPEKCMSNTKEGFEKAIENAAKSLKRA